MAQSVKPADGVSIGQVFLGKYRVDAILGQGGMGVVAECTHLALNERVAIKMLRQDVLLDQDAVQRFIREAQAAVKLKSEYVARVSDVGTFETGVPYMVMEFLEGNDLGELLKQRGVLPVQWAVELIMQTAEALAEAHSLSIVHRDVKPTNLFVTWRPDGSSLIKVLDFGISKSPIGADMQLTQTQSLLGTPAYMSPEQMRSARLVDTRTDIWSLGTVLYEVLEGRRPFEAESFSEMCVKVAVDAPAPMVNTPPALQQVILRCLAKTPEQRYANMAELGRDLVPFSADQHQASLLVERMHRMLRRSQYDWEGGSSNTNTAARVQREVRDAGSAPSRVTPQPQWSGQSEPSGVVYVPPKDKSQPFPRPGTDEASHPLQTVVNPRRNRAWPVVILLGLLVGAGVGIGVYIANGDDVSIAAAPSGSTPPSGIAPSGIAPSGITPSTKDDTKPAQPDTKPADVKPPEANATKPPEANAIKPPDDPTKPTDNKPPHAGGTPIRHGTPSKLKPVIPAVKHVDTPPDTTPKEIPKAVPAKPPCDPFSAMHDCTGKG